MTIALVALIGAAGCGGAATHHPAHTSTRPPVATLTSSSGTRTLVTGSYCWTARSGSSSVAGCGDAAAPRLIPGMPRIHVQAGETVVVHLGFSPTAPVDVTIGRDHYTLPAASVLRVRVRHGGFLTLDPRRGSDDVEYLARMVIAS
ncbi:MAG TPA: hypothetical protein VFJ24_03845 [Gaiellales bacterium]|nr:hypothetical protein [Gaiellales bacterium]